MMKIGAVMFYVGDFDTSLELYHPEGDRLQVYQFAA